MCVCVCVYPARAEENGLEVAPADKASDRGRRARGAQGERKHFETNGRLKIWIFLTFVNVLQDLELGAEAERQQAVGSQPREWGINTHTHRKGENTQYINQLSFILIKSDFICGGTFSIYSVDGNLHLSDFFPGPSILPTIRQRLGRGLHKLKPGTWWPTTALTEQVRALIGTDTSSHRLVTCTNRFTRLMNLPLLDVAPHLSVFLIVTWRTTLEDWTPEDWSEDIGVSGLFV